jgi:site-specific DNA-methyltransferase (adenine-specific)/site-specific DNA-methyltransferase (cytosine-N4-specific)
MGSGTTNIVAQRMSRQSIGIEIYPEYVAMVNSQFDKEPLTLLMSRKKLTESPQILQKLS